MKANGRVHALTPAATKSAVPKPKPAASSPTSTDPKPVPRSKPTFHTALASRKCVRETTWKATTSVRFCSPP